MTPVEWRFGRFVALILTLPVTWLAGCTAAFPSESKSVPPVLRPPAAQTPPAEASPAATAPSLLTVEYPPAGGRINTPVRVAGSTGLISGAVSAIIRDDAGKEVGRSSTTVDPDGPHLGSFVLNVEFPSSAAGRSGMLEVFTINPIDGSVQDVRRVPVELER